MDEKRTREHVRQVLSRHRSELTAEYDAVGVGVGKENLADDEYIIVVQLESQPAKPEEPVVVEGVPVQFRVTGRIELQNPETGGEQ